MLRGPNVGDYGVRPGSPAKNRGAHALPVLAPIKRDNRHAIVNRGAEGVPKVLIYYP